MSEPTRIQLSASFVPQGTRLSGIYEIDSPLAKGGMGEVYRGHTIETNEPVAIKLIRSDMADNEAALALFRREASALNRLHHEAIVRYFVFTLDPVLQRHYLAMELVEGESLSDVVARGPLSVVDAHALMKRIASGLQAAHERGVIHRDMSPDNVLVEQGAVTHARIIDFGIARSTRVGDATVIGGGFAGKYNYVSPEQLGLYGVVVDGKSDIYSLGLVIAQCLRGQPIDMGGSQVDIVDKRRRVPDLSDIDLRLRPILERMLQPDPANRPASMAEVAAWPLETARAGARPVTAKPAPQKAAARSGDTQKSGASKWAIGAVAGVVVLLAAGVAGYLIFADSWKFETPKPMNLDGPIAVLTPGDDPSKDSPPAVLQAVRYTKGYNGGDCFLALPTAATAQSADIDAFAPDEGSFNAFNDAFKDAVGWEASISAGLVARTQCAALQSLRKLLASNGATVGKLDIAAERVKAGETLEGKFSTAARTAALLLIDESGMVYDVTAQMSGAGDDRAFAMRLNSAAPSATEQSMLLAAIGSAAPVTAALAGGSQPSSEAFAAIGRAAETQGGPLDIAVKYFKLE